MKSFFSLLQSNTDEPYKKYTCKSLDHDNNDKVIELESQIDKFDRMLSGFAILKGAGYFMSIISSIALIGRLIGKQDFFNNGLVITIICFSLIGLGIASIIASYIVIHKVKHNNTKKELEQKLEALMNQYYQELGAVDPVIDIDVYMPEITIDDNGKEDKANPMFHACLNLPLKVYVDESNDEVGMIYLLSLIKVPKSSFIKIEKVNKGIHINAWNKKTPFDDKKFREYHIKTDAYGIYLKGYYVVTMKLDDEDYEFIVGGYDAQKLIELLQIN